jgi:hypothetical protein
MRTPCMKLKETPGRQALREARELLARAA